MAGEFDIIERFFVPLAADEPGAFGLTNDGAVIDIPPGRQLVVTTDTMVEGVHYLPLDPPESLGRKLLAVNLSDLAAMGATPLDYSLSLALPAGRAVAERLEWLTGFTAGLAAMQRAYGIRLSGGDLVATPGPACLTVTALGTVAPGAALTRSGAQVGDDVWVTGTIGDGALGLAVLQGRIAVPPGVDAAPLIARYRSPEPRVAVGARLAGVVHAAADVSDGLAADLAHICTASGVVARIDLDQIPLSPAARALVAAHPGCLQKVVGGGDDYELVFVSAVERSTEILHLADQAGVAITRIGAIGAPDEGRRLPVRIIAADGRDFDAGTAGYAHF